jgi:hypothetical protein
LKIYHLATLRSNNPFPSSDRQQDVRLWQDVHTTNNNQEKDRDMKAPVFNAKAAVDGSKK